MRRPALLLVLVLLASFSLVARAAPADRDGDGIPDVNDRCPDAPEDKDGFEDEDGCPDPDNDKDGIPDVNDRCPNEPETVNGYQDEDGCPDRVPVRVNRDHPPTERYLFFAEGKAEVVKEHRLILEVLTALLKARSEIKRVEVQGHADDPGTSAVNDRLSQRRAEAARQDLIKRGVAPTRLVARGYGLKRPLVKGRAAADRARNRRVAFEVRGPPPPAR